MDPLLIAAVVIIVVVILAFVINQVVSAHLRQATTGREDLMGKTASVKTALAPKGMVMYDGEIWAAQLDQGRAEPGEEVTIKAVDALKLSVTKKTKEAANGPEHC